MLRNLANPMEKFRARLSGRATQCHDVRELVLFAGLPVALSKLLQISQGAGMRLLFCVCVCVYALKHFIGS